MNIRAYVVQPKCVRWAAETHRQIHVTDVIMSDDPYIDLTRISQYKIFRHISVRRPNNARSYANLRYGVGSLYRIRCAKRRLFHYTVILNIDFVGVKPLNQLDRENYLCRDPIRSGL